MGNCAETAGWSEHSDAVCLERFSEVPAAALWRSITDETLHVGWWRSIFNRHTRSGTRFVLDFLPILGTAYTGRFSGMVNSIGELQAHFLIMPEVSSGRAPCWDVTIDVSALDRGSRIVIALTGIDFAYLCRRTLLYMFAGLIDRTLTNLGRPDRPPKQRYLPGH